MGSKTPQNHQQRPNDGASNGPVPQIVPKSASEKLGVGDDDCGGNNDDDDDDNDQRGVDLMSASTGNTDKKKKRKRSKNKNKKKIAAAVILKQSSPPRVVLSSLFPTGVYPEGEIVAYSHDENTSRTTGEETRYLDRMDDDYLNEYRQAAEVHRQVRHWAQQNVKPGQTMTEIAEGIEDGIRALTGHQGLEPGDNLKAGIAFPTGLALNNCAAHYTPNVGKEIALSQDDVMKVDFGVHVNGRIVDSAFTMAFDPVYDNLLASVKAATSTGVKHAGIDARMSEIGAAIQDVMESYEVEINGKTFPVRAIRNITGHDIKRYRIHGDKQVPFVKNSDETKMEEGEVFAIETFGSTGRGYVKDDDSLGVYGYCRNTDIVRPYLHLSSAKSLLKTIDQNFGTLVFCRRYLDRLGLERYLFGLSNLVSNGIVQSYSALSDTKGSYVAQFEHTILLRSTGKEIISRGEDY